MVFTNLWPKSLPERETIDDIRVIRSNFRVPHPSLRGMGGWVAFSELTRRSLIHIARDLACDVVNVQCVSSNARYSLAMSRELDVPLVVSIHGELSGDADNIYLRSSELRRAWRRLLDRADCVTAPSRYSLAEAERAYGQSLEGKSRVIRNGVDLDLFSGPRGQSGRPFAFALGRLVHNKGFDLLVEAWGRLPATLGDVDLVIGGDGPQRSQLERQIAASPAAGRIKLVGPMDRQQVAEQMKAAAVFVLPSRAEALGLALLEAMAAGTPVVAAAVGGVPEIVQDGHNGLLFDRGDPSALADAVISSLTSESECERRAAEGRTTVADMSWQACTLAFRAAYVAAGAGP